MKLWIVDDKHQSILSSMEIENPEEAKKIVDFLNKNFVTTKYTNLVVASNLHLNSEETEK